MTEVKSVVAHRSLDRTHPDGTITKVNIYIGDVSVVPADDAEASDDAQAWVEITGADDRDLYRRIYGADTMQAVYLAMQFAGSMLDDAKCAGEIEAEDINGRSVSKFGFPLFSGAQAEADEA